MTKTDSEKERATEGYLPRDGKIGTDILEAIIIGDRISKGDLTYI